MDKHTQQGNQEQQQTEANMMVSFIGKASDFIKFMNEAKGIFTNTPTIPAIVIKCHDSIGGIKSQLYINCSNAAK